MPIKPLSFKGDKKRREEPEDDDTWTTPDSASDLSGPVILVLPTTPATCLASDAHGNVFASAVENMVEHHVETAEPHDVRQVWVANQVAGSGQLSFKASHGGLRGDGEAGEPATELVIKMQARFKPRVQQSKASRAQEKVSRREMEQAVGRRLDEDEVKRLKRARKNGTYHEELLDTFIKALQTFIKALQTFIKALQTLINAVDTHQGAVVRGAFA
ncbi:hypothetical protein DV738_g739, partial [Chaetothyriales sp. CBS 135597]